jgi:hypothetical protein
MKRDEPETKTLLQRKPKTVSILLAIFLGPWTWIYTFKRDSWKLALGLGLNFNILIFIAWLTIMIRNINDENHLVYPDGLCGDVTASVLVLLLLVFAVFLLVTWIWAFIDSLFKSNNPHNVLSVPRKNGNIAALLSLFTGPWTWLYTYSKYGWKLWIGLIIAYLPPIALTLIDVEPIPIMIYFLGFIIVWIASNLDTVIRVLDRNSEFYSKS